MGAPARWNFAGEHAIDDRGTKDLLEIAL